MSLSSNISQFQASQLVPNAVLRDKSAVDGSGCICVAPLSPEILDYVAKAKGKNDFKSLFTKEHVQFLNSRYLGMHGSQNTNIHPFWQQLHLAALDELPKISSGLSLTVSTAVQ
ncbi:hypothetical protein DFQ30_005572, partial [Apophysomyces sp. BC1015]